MKSKFYKLYFLFIIHYLFININCFEEVIDTKDLDEISQCYYLEKTTYGQMEEITYELINNNLDKTLFIQFKSIESITIYKSNQIESNILFSRIKEENDFGNYYFTMEKNIEKYYIKIEISQSDIIDFKICFNLFEGKGNSFKKYSDSFQKKSSFDVINSGTFPFYINDISDSLIALRINKNYEKLFSISSTYIKVYNFESEKEISLYINELYKKGDYQYLICNLDINKKIIKEIIIEINLNIIKSEENNNKFEIELVDINEIHYGYQLNLKKEDINNMPVNIYYIDLKRYLFKQDLDILYLTNNLDNEIFISNSDNINNKDIIKLNKKLMIINKNYFINEKYKNINPYLLLIIIDENFIFNNNEEISYNFYFAGSSHDLYNYKEDITKDEFFNNNKRLLIKSDVCHTNYYINYFTDIENQKIIDYEIILGNINIFYSNKNDLSTNINDYFSKLDSLPIDNINNSIIRGNFGIFKINCLKGSEKFLSYIYSYNKNSLIIKFENQRALLYIEKNQKYSFQFEDKLKEETFTFRIRILKKEKGYCNLEINYNNNIYNALNEENFLELIHYKNLTSILNILLNDYYDMINKPADSLILEIIKGIDIDQESVIIQKSNIENSILPSNKYLFLEYEQKDSSQIKINLKNENLENITLCIHKGYGKYPYLIKPICNPDDIILKQNEEITLIYQNPYLSPKLNNINNNDNPLYISVYSDNIIKYSFSYEKFTTFNISDVYKDIEFNGKEIIQLENSKDQSMIYYQIISCQDINDQIPEYFAKPIFNYYFENKQKYEINNINTNLYKEYELHSNKPKIIFNSNGILKGKFKYIYGTNNKLKFNENYSKKINVEQNDKIIKISVEPPFNGDMLMNLIIISSDFEKYNGYCDLIDLYETLIENNDTLYYGGKFIQKQINNEDSNLVDIEIEAEQILDFNRQNVKIYVINTLKEINFDFFYNPVTIYINITDNNTNIKEKDKIINNFIIIIVTIGVICIIFILFRNCKNKNSDEINYERKNIKLNDGVIYESNKLFI